MFINTSSYLLSFVPRLEPSPLFKSINAGVVTTYWPPNLSHLLTPATREMAELLFNMLHVIISATWASIYHIYLSAMIGLERLEIFETTMDVSFVLETS